MNCISSDRFLWKGRSPYCPPNHVLGASHLDGAIVLWAMQLSELPPKNFVTSYEGKLDEVRWERKRWWKTRENERDDSSHRQKARRFRDSRSPTPYSFFPHSLHLTRFSHTYHQFRRWLHPSNKKDGVISTSAVFVQTLNINAKDACGTIPPAQVAFGFASILLAMIRVRSPPFREENFSNATI